jgi:myo-inositol 2-dehydrogenase/D-chiro-inositol 1-dehydrogenase
MKKLEIKTGEVSRRDFIKTSATGMAAVMAGKNVIFAASAKRKLKVALLGCGGRGRDALGNCLEAAKSIDGLELEIVGLADWFESKTQEVATMYNVPASKCMVGADAYKKLLETDADVVLMATPPNFQDYRGRRACRYEGTVGSCRNPAASPGELPPDGLCRATWCHR